MTHRPLLTRRELAVEDDDREATRGRSSAWAEAAAMPDVTPAETLRSAAALMRERAEKATRGPWRPVAGIWGSETFAAVIGRGGVPEDAETWLMATGRGGLSQEADADHAASWHPLVALAVADWLESTATDADDARLMADRTWSYGYCDSPAGIEAALKIARPYLGEGA